jgi:hypothetical protein
MGPYLDLRFYLPKELQSSGQAKQIKVLASQDKNCRPNSDDYHHYRAQKASEPVMNKTKIEDNLDVTRRKWAEEQASGVWEAAAQRQAERERREKKVEKPVHNETEK